VTFRNTLYEAPPEVHDLVILRPQERKGYTGSAIGIRGPSRAFAWAGRMNTATDWTQGCIAVASDGAIEEIAAILEEIARLSYGAHEHLVGRVL
jgi:hypothetical protein